MENSPIIEFHTLRLTIFEASFEWLSFVSVFDFVFFFQKAVLRTHSQAGFDGLVAYCFGGRLRYTQPCLPQVGFSLNHSFLEERNVKS